MAVFLGFFGFTFVLATRDLLYRFLMIQGLEVSTVLFLSGLGCFITALIANAIAKGSFLPNEWKFQVIRVVNGGLTYTLILKSFQLLNATSVSIFSKAYLPIMILLPRLGDKYSGTQKALASLSLASLLVFMFFTRDASEPLLGYLLLLLCTGLVIAEFVMLKTSTQKEGPFIVAAMPAIACMIVGGMGTKSVTLLSLTPGLWAFSFLSGVALFFVYFLSIYRYRILPLGISEYPALITALVILPVEYLLFDWKPTPLYIFNVVILILLLGGVLFLKNKNSGNTK